MRGRAVALGAILVVAALLRAWPIDHGLPFRYVPDTHVVRGALGMAASKDLAPPPNTYTSYPYLLPYLLLPAYAGLYGVGRATGAYASADDFAAQVTDDPTPLYRIARVLMALFGVLGTWLAWRLARRTVGRDAGPYVALLVATSFLLVFLSTSARPWIAIVTLVTLTAHAAAKWARRPSWRRAAWMGACAGLTMACHQSGALAVLLPAAAVFSRLRAAPARALGAGVLAAVLFGVTALLLGFPYLLRGSDAAVGVASANAPAETVDLGGQSFAFDAFGTGRCADVALGFLAAEPVLVLLALLGLLPAWRRLRERRGRAVVLLYPAALLGVFLLYEGTHVRYLSPAVPFLALLGGVACVRLARRPAGRVVLALLLAWPLAQAVRQDVVLGRTDTRTLMLAEVAEHVPPGATIAVEAYGPPLRLAAAGRDRLLAAGRWLSRQEEREASGATPADPLRPGYDLVPLERFYAFKSVWPHQWLGPAGVEKPVATFLAEVGARWLITTEKRPRAPRNSALDDVLARRGEQVAAVTPWTGQPPGHANLPMDLDRPLLDLWLVERPGPALVLWRLR